VLAGAADISSCNYYVGSSAVITSPTTLVFSNHNRSLRCSILSRATAARVGVRPSCSSPL